MPAYLSTSKAPTSSLARNTLPPRRLPSLSPPPVEHLRVHKRGTKETLFLGDGGEIGQTKSDAARELSLLWKRQFLLLGRFVVKLLRM